MLKVLIFLLILVSTNFLSAQKELTLNEAIKIALNRNTTLLKSTNSLKSSESTVKSSIGNFLPRINANAGWNYSKTENEVGDVTIESENRSYSAGVGSSWTLFDGLSNFATLSQSQNDLEAARYNLNRLKQDIVFQTISLYYDVINTMQLLKFKEDDVKWNQKNLETISERNRLGSVTLADVYAQQVRVGNAELEVIRTKNNLETSKSELLSFLGLDVLESYEFTDTLFSGEIEKVKNDLNLDYNNLSELVAKALENRLDYKGAELNLESAYDGLTIARSGHLPSLTNSISYGVGSEKVKNMFDNRTLSIGLSLNIPIFSGFSVESRSQFAEVQVENSKIELIELEREIKKSIQKTFLDLQAAEKGLKVSERNVLAAQENLKIESEKYSLGAGTLLNVLVANSEFTNAQTNYINAQFAYLTLSDQLKYHLGVLEYKSFE
ncbi:MAG: TolC family protein [Ignavibacteriaceae bacterium]|nr:TolC family protein [Ignavibacteriaceae bacterium]